MRWIILVVAAFTYHASFAGDGTLPTTNKLPEDVDCVQAKNDPYDPGQIMHQGKYKGQCVDSSEKRPAVIIAEDADSITFANFRHMGQFWIAKVPKVGVSEIWFRIDPFAGIPHIMTVAHTLLGFEMAPGKEIQLTPQNANQKEAQPLLVSDFYFSVDYMAPSGAQFGLIGGMFKDFLTTERFISANDRDSGTPDPNFPIQKIMLTALDQDSRDALLEGAIRRSNDRGIRYVYDTFDYNCTTEQFNLFDDNLMYPYVKHKIKRFKESLLLHFFDPVIGPSIKALYARDLVDKPAPKPVPDQTDGAEFLDQAPDQTAAPAPAPAAAEPVAAIPVSPEQNSASKPN